MATSWCIELETGTSTGRLHPHNGYYAGDFTSVGDQPGVPLTEEAPTW